MPVILQCCAPLEEIGLWIGIYNLVGTSPAPWAHRHRTPHQGHRLYTPAFVLPRS